MTESVQTDGLTRIFACPWPDYELLDAGNGKKLERWGAIVTIRPDLHADFESEWPIARWLDMAHWEFEEQSSTQGCWQNIKHSAPEQWRISYEGLIFCLKLTQFKHVGLFPEQQANWRFIEQRVITGQKLLNLFAYTGAASLVACSKGAEVVHVDSVKRMVSWANENRECSALPGIRWVIEDALKFAQRELRRGKKYDGIVMDPPAWGLGVKREKWKLESHLSELIELACGLMKPGAFLILNTYSPRVGLADLAGSAESCFSVNQLELKPLWMRSKTGKELFCGNLLRAIK